VSQAEQLRDQQVQQQYSDQLVVYVQEKAEQIDRLQSSLAAALTSEQAQLQAHSTESTWLDGRQKSSRSMGFISDQATKDGPSSRPIARRHSLWSRLLLKARSTKGLAYLSRTFLNAGRICGGETLALPSSLIARITSNWLALSCPDNLIFPSAKSSHRMVHRLRLCLARLLIKFRCGLLVFVSFSFHL
jgi:hypothetical protein